MLTYYVLYEPDLKGTPVGIMVAGRGGNAILWDHRARGWVYDPNLVGRITSDDAYWDRFETTDRETAERLAPGVTGGEQLPDEDTIRWIFQWKGDPPQSED